MEIINHYIKKRDSVVKTITEKFDTFYDGKEDDLKEIISFINYTNALIFRLKEMSDATDSTNIRFKDNRNSIQRLLHKYDTLIPFDEIHARKTLVNGLVKIIVNKNSFDGTYFFDKKGKAIHWSKIVKIESNIEELKRNYEGFRNELTQEIRRKDKKETKGI